MSCGTRGKRTTLWSVLPVAALLVAACGGDQQAPSAAPDVPRPALLIVVDSNETSWDYYSADISITREAGVNDAGIQVPQGQTNYTVTRRLIDGVWQGTSQYQPHLPMGTGPAAPADVDPARFEIADDLTYHTLYSRAGYPMNPPDPTLGDYSGLEQPPGADTVPPFPPASAPLAAQRGPSSGAPRPTLRRSAITADPRAWLANVVVTPANRGRMLASLARYAGAARGTVGRLQRYTRTDGEMMTEMLVDPDIGAVVEENVALRGRLRAHVRREFTPIGHERYLLTAVRVEGGDGSSSGPGIATTIRFTNVHIEARGNP
jgi:hypothetical protein